MSDQLRVFTNEGIEKFRQFVAEVTENPKMDIPAGFLYDDSITLKISSEVKIDNLKFESKYEAAKYLDSIICQSSIESPYSNSGLWDWLAAYYFEQICPKKAGDIRKVGKDHRYVHNTKWNLHYRHLLAAPVEMYSIHGENARLLLSNKLDQMGDFTEQLLSRQIVAQNKELIKVANTLYWDSKKSAPVPSVRQTEHLPGTLRRFVDIVQQFELTYDLYSMNSHEIISLLPREFDKYLKT